VELRHLQSFIAVAIELNFTRAAWRLNIAQPPLSQRIRELEEELGVKLFDRSTRKVSLTIPGKVFLEQVQPIFQQLDGAVEACRRAERGETGRLRLGYTGRASQERLPSLVRDFRRACPDVNLDILGPLATGELRLKLLNDELDAALCFLPIEGPGMQSLVFMESELSIALNEAHPLAQAANLTLSQLASEPFVAYPAGKGFHLRKAMDELCQKAGFVPRVVRETAASQTLLCLIAAGAGVGLIPREIEALNIEGVVYRPLPPDIGRLRHGLAWLSGNANPALAALLTMFGGSD
jgi:DNA-binding transcriptional LysR family regulator